MSYNVDHAEIIYNNNFRMSVRSWNAFEKQADKYELEVPEIHPFDDERFKKSDDKKDVLLHRFPWGGEGSGWATQSTHGKSTLEKILAKTKGDADIVLTWEGGDSHSGVRVRDGKITWHEVVMALGEEEK
jgi:hypothetical protein